MDKGNVDYLAPDTSTEFQEKRRRLDVASLDIPELIKSLQDIPSCKAVIAAATLRIKELENERYHKQQVEDHSTKKFVNSDYNYSSVQGSNSPCAHSEDVVPHYETLTTSHVLDYVDSAPCDQTKSNHSFDMFSNEILDKILSYCNTVEHLRLSSVCKRWYSLCVNRISTIKTLNFRELSCYNHKKRQYCRKDIMYIITLNNGSLSYLNLDLTFYNFKTNFKDELLSNSGLDDDDLGICTAISNYCPNLETLSLKLYEGNKLEHLGHHLPKNLKDLRIQDSMIGLSDLQDAEMTNVLANARNLEKLHLEFFENLSGSCIIDNLKQNKMTSLSFYQCLSLKPELIDFIVEHYHDSLQHLSVSASPSYKILYYNCRSDTQFYNSNTVFDSYIQTRSSKKLIKLTSFHIRQPTDYIEEMGQDVIGVNLSMFSLMPNLRELDISYNCDLQRDPDLIKVIAEMCPLIELLFLTGSQFCLSSTIEPLINMKKLQKLHMNNSKFGSRFDNESDIYFSNEIVAHLDSLTYLDLSGTDVCDQAAAKIISNNHRLSKLDLRKDQYITFTDIWYNDDDISRSNDNKIEVVIDFNFYKSMCDGKLNKPEAEDYDDVLININTLPQCIKILNSI